MPSVDTQSALLQHLQDSNFGVDVAWENQNFDPGVDPYIEPKMYYNETTPYSLSRTDQNDGVFRMILHWPMHTGDVAAKQKATEIFEAFAIGTVLSYGDAQVTITSHQQYDGNTEDVGWYRLILSVRFRVFLRRT